MRSLGVVQTPFKLSGVHSATSLLVVRVHRYNYNTIYGETFAVDTLSILATHDVNGVIIALKTENMYNFLFFKKLKNISNYHWSNAN